MRKKKYFCMLLVASQIWMLLSCNDDWQLPESEISPKAITVGEAKTFFEKQIMQSGKTLDSKDMRGFATNFTPQWKHAVISGQEYMAAVDVPIVANFSFSVYGWADEVQKTDRFDVNLLQKLIVVKDLRSNNLGAYVVTIIPDKDYALTRKHISAMDFPNFGTYGNFSGLIIYSLPLSTIPVRVNRHWKGELIDAASFFGLWDNPSELQIARDKMKGMLEGFNLIRIPQTLFRANEIDGGPLPEVVITGSGGGGGNNNGWDDWWNQLMNNNPPPPPLDPTLNGSNGGASGGAQSIINSININASGINAINGILRDMLYDCGYQYVSSYLSSNLYTFSSVTYDPNMKDPGSYNPFTGELKFKGESSIYGAFPEEFLHLFQNSYYPNGTGQYSGTIGGVNIEFEAKVMMDIICVMAGNGCPMMGATQNNGNFYSDWIMAITNYGSNLPTYWDLITNYPNCGNKSYWDFMNDFKNDPLRPQYNLPIKNDLLPNALLDLRNAKCY